MAWFVLAFQQKHIFATPVSPGVLSPVADVTTDLCPEQERTRQRAVRLLEKNVSKVMHLLVTCQRNGCFR